MPDVQGDGGDDGDDPGPDDRIACAGSADPGGDRGRLGLRRGNLGRIRSLFAQNPRRYAPVGKLGFDTEKLNENATTLILAVVRAKPSAAKGKYVKKISICSTMSPALEVEEGDLTA